jgi:hypothetical protein
MRTLIRKFDAWLCTQNKVFTFCQDTECLLKLQLTPAPHVTQLDQLHIEKGEMLLVLHLWNDHLPTLSPVDSDFTWAAKTRRLFRNSLRMVAKEMQCNPRFTAIRAVMGTTALFSPPGNIIKNHPMQRFGFTVIPYQSRLGYFGEFWENFYAWLLIWAYNPSSARKWNFIKARRSEIWMAVDGLFSRYIKL